MKPHNVIIKAYAEMVLGDKYGEKEREFITRYLEAPVFFNFVAALDHQMNISFSKFKASPTPPKTSSARNVDKPPVHAAVQVPAQAKKTADKYEFLPLDVNHSTSRANASSSPHPALLDNNESNSKGNVVVNTPQVPPADVTASTVGEQNQSIPATTAASATQSTQTTQTTPTDAVVTPPAQLPLVEAKKPVSSRPDLVFVAAHARADEPYKSQIKADKADAAPYRLVDITGITELNLQFNDELEELSGKPPGPGEFNIEIVYHFLDEEISRHATLRLTVMPNPKSMWLNLPSDKTDIYWKPDEDAQFVKGEAFDLVAASKRGRSHAHVGSFRDDDFKIAHLDDSKWCVAIVSDGAGSCKFSRRGSQIICDTSLNHIKTSMEDGLDASISLAAENYSRALQDQTDAVRVEALKSTLRNELYKAISYAAFHSLGKINEEIKLHPDLDAKLKDFSSTALIGICKKFEFGTLCAAYWVGDGAVGVYSEKNGVRLLGAVDSGEFSGQTRFLDKDEVSGDALIKRLKFEIFDDVTAFILMSDGVSDPKFETEARLARANDWNNLWADINAEVAIKRDGETDEKAHKLLGWLDFWSQGNHDDRTIAIIY